jgi:RHS repeat-associated protein
MNKRENSVNNGEVMMVTNKVLRRGLTNMHNKVNGTSTNMSTLITQTLCRTSRRTLGLLLLLACVPAAWAATAPGAPTIGTATGGNAQATVAFTAPTSNGGSAITSYKATSTPGSKTGTCTTTPCTVTGLTNGTAYTFKVTATNAIGMGAASAASNSVTPATVPGAPTIGTATGGNAQATVAFTAPTSNGGSAITSYTATSTPGSKTGTCTATPCTVTGLTNGTAYTFTVKATNAKGIGAASTASNSVTPATVPGTPTGATAVGGNAQATVAFVAPASNGGSAVTGYTVTSLPAGGVDSNAGTTGLSHVITGLTNGTAYTFTVKAANANGTSVASTASNSVTPATLPGAPTGVTAVGGNAQATVTFTSPVSNGGSAITGYTVTSLPAGGVDSNAGTTGLSHIITGLTNGTAYTFTVTATNAIGTSVTSAASNSVTVNAGIAQAYYIYTDHLDTPRQITDTGGNIVWTWNNLDPFGNNPPNENPSGQGTFVNPLRFPGQYADKETNTYYNINRNYDPSIGRYVQSDPIGLRGGINTYTYVGGNPLSRIDPTGKFFFIPIIVAAIVDGGATSIIAGSALVVGGAGIWMANNFPPGFWPGDKGAAEWGRRNDVGAREGKGRFHGIKQGCPGSKATDNYGVNPDTGDVIDPAGDPVGNLGDVKSK